MPAGPSVTFVAHLIDIADLTPWALLTRLAGSRFSFARMFDADIARPCFGGPQRCRPS
jgi:uncharacterized protein (DUF2336 family)